LPRAHSVNGMFFDIFENTRFWVFFYFIFQKSMTHTNTPYQFASTTRNTLRTLQASRTNSDLRIDKTLQEILLDITWRVAEKLSGERLPR